MEGVTPSWAEYVGLSRDSFYQSMWGYLGTLFPTCQSKELFLLSLYINGSLDTRATTGFSCPYGYAKIFSGGVI